MNKLDSLAEQVKKIKEVCEDRPSYPKEFIKELIDFIDSGEESLGFIIEHLGLNQSTVFRWRRDSSFKVRGVKHGHSGFRYTISTKIEVCEMVLDEGQSVSSVAKAMKISVASISKWIVDYQNGLFNIEHCTQITRKKIISYDVIIGEIDDLQKQIDKKKIEAGKALDREYAEKKKGLKL